MLQFGIVAGGSDYYLPVLDGWETACNRTAMIHPDDPVVCHHRQSNENQTCEELVRELLTEYDLDGLAFVPCYRDDKDESLQHRPAFLEYLKTSDVPMLTFNSDHESYHLGLPDRLTHIGADQHFFGRTLAKLLRQLRPDGGLYAHVGDKAERIAGFETEIQRNNDRDGWGDWWSIEYPPDEIEFDGWVAKMEYYIEEQNATCIVTMKQSPMRSDNWTQMVERHPDVLFIGVDAADYQLSYLNRGYVHGLVGQMPFDIGRKAFNLLYQNAALQQLPASNYTATDMVAYNRIPTELPSLQVDHNRLEDHNLQYVGYTCFGIVAILTILSCVWTWRNRTHDVVRAAQPFFLVMISAGVLLMSSSILPLSMDDSGADDEGLEESQSKAICMGIPWLAFTGFTVVFSALFSKTWRVNQLFRSSQQYSRVEVTERDVLAPFLILLLCNFAVLACWTKIDPLVYVREDSMGTDYWNRVLSSHGGCRSQSGDSTAVSFLTPLALINITAVLIACYQAHRAKDIKSEFSESKYIALTVFSLFQAIVTGIPVVSVVRDIPEAFYLILTFTIFVLCLAVLLLIFLPKIAMQHKYAQMSKKDQKKLFKQNLQASAQSSRHPAGPKPALNFRVSGLRDTMTREFNLSLLNEVSDGKPPTSTDRSSLSKPLSSKGSAQISLQNGPIKSNVASLQSNDQSPNAAIIEKHGNPPQTNSFPREPQRRRNSL